MSRREATHTATDRQNEAFGFSLEKVSGGPRLLYCTGHAGFNSVVFNEPIAKGSRPISVDEKYLIDQMRSENTGVPGPRIRESRRSASPDIDDRRVLEYARRRIRITGVVRPGVATITGVARPKMATLVYVAEINKSAMSERPDIRNIEWRAEIGYSAHIDKWLTYRSIPSAGASKAEPGIAAPVPIFYAQWVESSEGKPKSKSLSRLTDLSLGQVAILANCQDLVAPLRSALDDNQLPGSFREAITKSLGFFCLQTMQFTDTMEKKGSHSGGGPAKAYYGRVTWKDYYAKNRVEAQNYTRKQLKKICEQYNVALAGNTRKAVRNHARPGLQSFCPLKSTDAAKAARAEARRRPTRAATRHPSTRRQ